MVSQRVCGQGWSIIPTSIIPTPIPSLQQNKNKNKNKLPWYQIHKEREIEDSKKLLHPPTCSPCFFMCQTSQLHPLRKKETRERLPAATTNTFHNWVPALHGMIQNSGPKKPKTITITSALCVYLFAKGGIPILSLYSRRGVIDEWTRVEDLPTHSIYYYCSLAPKSVRVLLLVLGTYWALRRYSLNAAAAASDRIEARSFILSQ